MTDTVIVQEDGNTVVVQEVVSLAIEVLSVGPQGPQGSPGPQGIQGLKGDTGNIGPQGLKGDTGNTGAAGPQGLTGPQGIAGPQGLQGPTGLTGPAGPEGLTGAKGDTGDTGPQGPAGVAGPQGDTGPQGPQGLQGIQGVAGPKGDTGDQGIQGLTGPAGPQGLQGMQGPVGPQGPQGDKGDTGAGLALKGSQPTVEDLPATGNTEGGGWLVAGVLYVWNGTSWTSAGNIQGPAGATGPQGPIGLTGPQGEPGLDGSDASVTNANVLSALGFTPVNKAGDTMLGALAGPGFAGGYFDIDPLATPAAATGRIRWNSARGVPTFGLAGGNVEMELGEGIQLCHNGEATPLNEGEVVYLYGAHGDLPSLRRASNSSELLSSKTFGVVTETIAANGNGFVTTFGFVNGLDTSAIVAGTALWLGATPGSYTATKPVAPAHTVFVGIVTKSNAGNGAVFVNPQNGYELDELHDVLITAPAENNFFVRGADGLWKNRALASLDVTTALGFTPYDAVNPSGFITASALAPYLTSASAATAYQASLGFTPANKAGDTFTGAVLTSNSGGFTANSAAKLWTDSGRGRLDLYEGAAQTKSLRVMNANGFGIVGMTSAENLELWTNGVARITINGSTGTATFAANATINSGADSRVLLQSSGVTQGQFQTTASAVRLASNNTLPLYLSQNGVDLLDVTTTAIVGNRQFRVPNSASYLYAFVGEQTAGAGKYNLYMSGTAANYLAGALQVDGGITGNLTGNVTGSVSGTAATITGVYGGTLTSGQVTTALGFTPYNATNPSGYTSNVGDVTLTGTQTLSDKTLNGAVLNNGYTEGVFAITGTTPALSPTNGSIQTWTLSGASTPTAGTWASGQSITLMVDDGSAFAITWTSLAVTWETTGGAAPTLATTGYTVILLWKVGTTIYGAKLP